MKKRPEAACIPEYKHQGVTKDTQGVNICGQIALLSTMTGVSGLYLAKALETQQINPEVLRNISS